MLRLYLALVLLMPAVHASKQRHSKTQAVATSRSTSDTQVSPQQLLEFQRILAELGYGTRFTATLDEQTIRAVREYQRKCGLTENGTFDDATSERLFLDWGATTSIYEGRPMLEVFLQMWDEGYVRARGTWLQMTGPESGALGHVV
jgi:peptidoglycan hydrolase-like protein with peptidoglycan-binding domain